MNPESFLSSVRAAADAAGRRLLAEQQSAGYWAGRIESGAIPEAEYILLLSRLGRQDDPGCLKAAATLRQKAHADGGWRRAPGGPPDLDASVLAYAALKHLGAPADEPCMRLGRAVILDLGGVEHTGIFTRRLLARSGFYPRRGVPVLLPEHLTLPPWTGCDLYAIAAWLRVLLVPMCLVRDDQEPASHILEDLSTHTHPVKSVSRMSWVARALYHGLILADRIQFTPWRRQAAQTLSEWMIARFDGSDGPGAGVPSLIRFIMALRDLGYDDTHPYVVRAMAVLDSFIDEEGDILRLQPCRTPVWDTAHSVVALRVAGMAVDDPRLLRAVGWLADREVTTEGDWKIRNPHVHPSGWARAFADAWYPDIGNTAMVLQVLQAPADEDESDEYDLARHITSRRFLPDEKLGRATQRGLAWMLSMQNPDGGWASWDKTAGQVSVPFPFDVGPGMLDISTAEVTGSVLTALRGFGYGRGTPAAQRAVAFLQKTQHGEGHWPDTMFNHPVYITWKVLQGLCAVGEDMTQPYCVRAADWLRSRQNPDGGWSDGLGGQSRPLHTVWALMGLMAAGGMQKTVDEGIACLIRMQRPDGGWEDHETPAPREPGLLSYTNTLAPLYFPLMALGKYLRK